MENLLVAAGIAIIAFVLWKDWARETTLQKEKEDGKLLLGELADARKEVEVLLEQLETASEKIVDEISFGLEEIKIQVSSSIENQETVEGTAAGSDGKTMVLKRIRSGSSSKSNASNRKTAAEGTKKTVAGKKGRDLEVVRAAPDKGISPKHQMVYAMADLGHSEEEIARQMKIGKGEVSLLLQLRRKGVEGDV